MVPCDCLGNIGQYSWHRTSEAVEGRGKTSGLWRIRSTWTTYWYSEYPFNKQERISLSLELHVYRRCSVWKRKVKKNWCRKKAQLCLWICVGVAQGYPRKPGTPSSSTALGREKVVLVHDLPVASRGEMVFFCLNWGSWENDSLWMADVRLSLPFRLLLPFFSD